MKTYIDFYIFESPVRPYANVTGYVDLPALPKIGDEVSLFKDGIFESDKEFPGHFRVESITPVECYPDNVVVGLKDVVMSTKEAARRLADKLEVECGLFCLKSRLD